jgi:hypothetical protein
MVRNERMRLARSASIALPKIASSFTPRLGFVYHISWAKAFFGSGLVCGSKDTAVFVAGVAFAEGSDVSAIERSPQYFATTIL